jgi:hypothetical protein
MFPTEELKICEVMVALSECVLILRKGLPACSKDDLNLRFPGATNRLKCLGFFLPAWGSRNSFL